MTSAVRFLLLCTLLSVLLSADEAAVEAGLEHWAFQAVQKPPVPPVQDPARIRNPVDAFVRAQQVSRGIAANPPAEKWTLLRRACFDLTGLPPTPEQIDTFMADESGEAFAQLVDRLLASKAYGERWGRYWLDQARYADTSGDATDMPIPEARLYRDYVIDAFNLDLPYDTFIQEQLAGDLIAEADGGARWEPRMIATGYIALSRRYGNSKFAEKHLIVENTLDTIGRSILGMTLACARCHDHKFDPVSMEDYYGLYGYFKGVEYPHAGTEHARYRQGLVMLERDPEKLSRFKQLQADVAQTGEDLRSLKRKRKSDKSAELKREETELKKKLDQLNEEKSGFRLAWAIQDAPDQVGDQRIHLAGDPHKQGPAAPRGFIQVLAKCEAVIPEQESGRRQLADWLVSAENPLTSRVMVNRVWQYHFGRGLVDGSSFGKQGRPPSHPALLDWLAASFVEENWSIKSLHRLIMNSATYQQASRGNPASLAKDAPNQWLWRYERHRLDGEAIRDALLAVSGQLDRRPAGPHPFPENAYEKYSQGNPFRDDYDTNKRSVYMMVRRNGRHPFWELFDPPDRGQSTAARRVSTVPMQALFLMNSSFVKKQAGHFAQRLAKKEAETGARVALAYRLAYGRQASAEEQEMSQAYIASLAEDTAWASFCRALLASNEFIYID